MKNVIENFLQDASFSRGNSILQFIITHCYILVPRNFKLINFILHFSFILAHRYTFLIIIHSVIPSSLINYNIIVTQTQDSR